MKALPAGRGSELCSRSFYVSRFREQSSLLQAWAMRACSPPIQTCCSPDEIRDRTNRQLPDFIRAT